MHRANLRVYGTGTPFLMKWERHDDVYIRQFTLIYHKSIKMTKVFMSHLNTLIKQTKTCIIFITPVSSVTCFVCRISEIIKQKTKNTTSSFNILFFSSSFFIYSTHFSKEKVIDGRELLFIHWWCVYSSNWTVSKYL